MRRIGLAVILAVGLFLVPLAAGAQQTEKVRRIGFLAGTNRFESYDALRQGLRELPRAGALIRLDRWWWRKCRRDVAGGTLTRPAARARSGASD
jgi:hypothetical protein